MRMVGAGSTADHSPTRAACPLAPSGTLAVPLFPSLVAVIVADPSPAPVTRPAADTVATWGASVSQVTVRPGSALPAASLVVAVSCTVPPTGTLADAGGTSTDATGAVLAVTVTPAAPLFPWIVAVTVADPSATPVTRPAVDTVATWGASVAHVAVYPLSGSPSAFWAVAASCTVPPTGTFADAGVTSTDTTVVPGPA